MAERKRMNPFVKSVIGIAAALVLLLSGVLGFRIYETNFAVDSTVSLDVNPSLEIQVNQQERVLNVIPLSDDGKIVLGDMDLRGSDLEVSVNALIGSMLRHGYLSDIANSILVSVDNRDAEKGALLQKKLTEEINGLLQTNTFTGAVLSQTIRQDDDIRSLAEEYGISQGKAQLIRQIVSQHTRYDFSDLAPLSINELNLISETGKLSLDQVESVGTASDKRYIGEERAKEIALQHAGTPAAEIVNYTCEMDYEQGKMIYEIEFDHSGLEYDYEIDALTGEILNSKKEQDDDARPAEPGSSDSSVIGEAAAKNAAFDHAGVSSSEAKNVVCKLDRENGRQVYEVEFTCNGYEYDYEIDAQTGAVLNSKKERDDDAPTGGQNGSSAGDGSNIGEAAAKNAAFTHAGVSSGEAKNVVCKLDRENGQQVYEVEFTCNGYEYDYEIDAQTGAVLNSKKERDDDAPTGSSAAESSVIGEASAKNAAFNHAGVSSSEAKNVVCKLDRENGRQVYEVEFTCNGYEYDYEIDAQTGEVLSSKKERDDDAPTGGQNGSSAAESSVIGETAAKNAAFNHAGVSSSEAKNVVCKLDRENGQQVYEVEFTCNGYEYDYEIDAQTGKILKSEKERG